MVFGDSYKGKTVLVTGHTGFKGSWLSEWLLLLGARVVGYSLDPPTRPSHFDALQTGKRLTDDIRADVRDLDRLHETLTRHTPDFIFHLAAQPIVRLAFDEPHYTFDTNVVGSLNVLEAVRRCHHDCVLVMITTDKVYENEEWVWSYRENDRLGGFDPYSASKACAEIVISSYQQSFFKELEKSNDKPLIAIGTARGGNVLGGGDWAQDRIVPDSMKCLSNGETIPVRNRKATRPWQHVLELLSGYLHLGSEIARARDGQNVDRLRELCSAFNIGPHITSNKPVESLVTEILKHWPGKWDDLTEPDARHEAGRLNLTIDKAYHTLGWEPTWSFEETIQHTVEWYRKFYAAESPDPASVQEMTHSQIRSYADGLAYKVIES